MTCGAFTPEGDFNIRMPLAAPSEGPPPDEQLPPIVLHMRANPSGTLRSLSTNEKTLRGGFEELHREMREIIQDAGGPGSAGCSCCSARTIISGRRS